MTIKLSMTNKPRITIAICFGGMTFKWPSIGFPKTNHYYIQLYNFQKGNYNSLHIL